MFFQSQPCALPSALGLTRRHVIGFLTLLVISLIVTSSPAAEVDQAHGQTSNLLLSYTVPASEWETQALPIGNGRLGGMVFGTTPVEHVQFNEDSLWLGDEKDTGSYQNFGDVFIAFEPRESSHYQRSLDLNSAVARGNYSSGTVPFTEEFFCSR